MSYLLEMAQRNIQNMSVANPGRTSTPTPDMRGGGGGRSQSPSESYGEERNFTSMKKQVGPGGMAQTTTDNTVQSPFTQATSAPSGLNTARQYVGMGSTLANIGSNLTSSLSPLVSKALGGLGTAGSALLTAYSLYNIASGKGSTGDYVNVGTKVAQPVFNAYRALDKFGESLASASGATTTGGLGSVIGGVASGIGSAMQYNAIRQVGTTLASKAFLEGARHTGLGESAANPLYGLGYTIDYGRTPNIEAAPFAIADLIFGENEGRTKIGRAINPVGRILGDINRGQYKDAVKNATLGGGMALGDALLGAGSRGANAFNAAINPAGNTIRQFQEGNYRSGVASVLSGGISNIVESILGGENDEEAKQQERVALYQYLQSHPEAAQRLAEMEETNRKSRALVADSYPQSQTAYK